jgi:hypothetical protein
VEVLPANIEEIRRGIMSLGEILGYMCFSFIVIFWLATYFGIIWRGFKDRSYGMPLVVVGMNISWEFVFSFIYPPTPAVARYCVPAWFLLDIPISIQCLVHCKNEFKDPLAKKFAQSVFLVTICICLALVLGFITEFRDFMGMYSAFGTNILMSFCFVLMLINRDDVRAQSIYIALFKCLGTLFGFLWAYFWFPLNINAPLTSIIPTQTQPMVPFIKLRYSIILPIDLLYITLIDRKCLEGGINPWKRF